jgi:integrase
MSKNATLTKVIHPRYRWRVYFPDGDERKQKYFRTKSEATAFSDQKNEELEKEGKAERAITKAEKRAVMMFRDGVGDLPGDAGQVTLADAVSFYLDHMRSRNKSITCAVIGEKLQQKLTSENKSQRHIDTIVSRLREFMALYGDWLACDVYTELIDEYLNDCAHLAPQTIVHRRRAMFQLFQHAIILKAASVNPVASAMSPKVVTDEPGILAPHQVQALLDSADKDTVSGLALSFFGGVRRAEIERLDWSEIDIEAREIEIKAKKAKSAQRRFIPMSDNLVSWLTPHAKEHGLVVKGSYDWRKGCDTARAKAAITEWPHNAGRHSYASYHLAMHNDPGKLAMALGHPDPRLLFSRYRKLVGVKAARAFWGIKL